MKLEHISSGNKTVVEKEVDSRRFQDLEEKRAMLTQKVYAVLNHHFFNEKNISHDQKIYDKYERIVYANTEVVEKIFEATHDFYEAMVLYEKQIKQVAEQFGLDENLKLASTESPKENPEKFFHSIECQKNKSRARVLNIQALSHEFDMLLSLDGLQFLKDRDINDFGDRFKSDLDITKELFLAKLHGLLAKTEVHARIKKENLHTMIKRSLGKTEEQAELFVQEVKN